MDKKKKISIISALFICMFLSWAFPTYAQDVDKILIKDKYYEDIVGKDSITLFLKILGHDEKSSAEVDTSDLRNHLDLLENNELVPNDNWTVKILTDGQRIPNDYTISVLVDQSIPISGKDKIYDAVYTLVKRAHDGCVYLSFFGEEVSESKLVTRENYKDFYNQFQESAETNCFYSALYAKLTEFNFGDTEYDDWIKKQKDYKKNRDIFLRAGEAQDHNLLFIFTKGNDTPLFERLNFIKITDYQGRTDIVAPKVYAFFYDTGNGIDKDMERALIGVTNPRDSNHELIRNRQGNYMSSDNIQDVLQEFEQALKSEMYDFGLTYQVPKNKSYSGIVNYVTLWDGEEKGNDMISIGSPENPWPTQEENVIDSVKKYLTALIVALLTIILFIAIMKIVIPCIKSTVFAAKYYQKYKPMENVKTLTCPLCRTEIMPGEKIVNRCRHIMHVRCWKANDFKCVEYGQNCKDGIQEHIHWDSLFSKETLRDCFLAIMGVCAGLVSWIIYELLGRSLFKGLATGIVRAFFNTDGQTLGITTECISKISAFLTIGLLLGFFLSFIFRYFDGVKRRSWTSFLEITGLSLLSSLIGMSAFALGGIILCLWLSPSDTFIPWYCSFPAYLLFSVCISLSLTIKSDIPMKSALLGGLVSAIIGFFVLYYSRATGKRGWMNMLIDFVIYGGGLGASLVTVRMLAEKYFLVVKNGIKNGLRIPIHKWMNVGNKVTIGMTQQCEIQMAWEKSNKVAKEHVQLYVDKNRSQAMLKPLATTTFNMRMDLNSANKPIPLFNGDTFKIGDTIFQYVEN